MPLEDHMRHSERELRSRALERALSPDDSLRVVAVVDRLARVREAGEHQHGCVLPDGGPIELATPDGGLLILYPCPGGADFDCDCGRKIDSTDAGVALEVRDQAGDTKLSDLLLCGGCVAEGLSILLGRRHVQAGGKVEDLSDDANRLRAAGPDDSSRTASAGIADRPPDANNDSGA